VGKSLQERSRINRAVGSLEDAANRNHPNDAVRADEAVFEESPLVVPANQSRVDFEGLERSHVAAKLRL